VQADGTAPPCSGYDTPCIAPNNSKDTPEVSANPRQINSIQPIVDANRKVGKRKQESASQTAASTLNACTAERGFGHLSTKGWQLDTVVVRFWRGH
jgi:hypothetical protein